MTKKRKTIMMVKKFSTIDDIFGMEEIYEQQI